jgi:hypothetical protein
MLDLLAWQDRPIDGCCPGCHAAHAVRSRPRLPVGWYACGCGVWTLVWLGLR